MAGRVLFLMLLLTTLVQSVPAQETGKAADDFALEVEREIASQQIAAVREGKGEVCSYGEIPYWEQLTGKYLSYGRVAEAEKLWLSLVKECAQHNTYLHPYTLQVADELVRFYSTQEERQKATAFLEELLLAGMKQAGNEEEHLLPLLDTGIGLYGLIGDVSQQEQLLRRGLVIIAGSNRSSRLDVATWKIRLADFLFEHENLPEAQELYLDNAPLLLGELPQHSIKAVEIRQRLLQILASQNNWAAAEPHILTLIGYIRERVGEEHPTYIEWLGRLAFVYTKQGKIAAARQVLEQAIPLAEKLGEQGKELLVSLQDFQKNIEGGPTDPLAPKGTVCSEEGVQLYRQQTEEWATILRQVATQAAALNKKIEETDAYDLKLQEARRAKRNPKPESGESPQEARKRATAYYNKLFVSGLGTWGDAGLARSCLKELAELDHALGRYLAGAEKLYQGWDGLVSTCSEQDQTELLETSLNYRAFVHDGPLEEFTLRHDLLDSLYADCTDRMVSKLWTESLLEENEQEFCPNLGAVVEGSALSQENLQNLRQGELRLLRNAIFAKYGRSFRANDLQSFFYGNGALPCGFYFRTDPNFSNTVLSDNDRKNVSLLKSME